jgi:uncharacterized phage protein (TIGR01671 family)
MREIKFKSLYRGEWYEVEEMFLENGVVTPTKFKGHDFSPDSEHVKCTVQYTGLKDKNGKDIYDGGIYKTYKLESENTRFVVYKNGCFCGKQFESNEGIPIAYDKDDGWDNFNEEIIVIGNIYSNPELLE